MALSHQPLAIFHIIAFCKPFKNVILVKGYGNLNALYYSQIATGYQAKKITGGNKK